MTDDVLIAIISSGVLVTILNFVFTLVKDWYDRRKGLRAAMRIMLDDRLCHLGEKYLNAGYITTEQLKVFTKMHASYKSLGGNGYHKTLMAKIDALPNKKDDKE